MTDPLNNPNFSAARQEARPSFHTRFVFGGGTVTTAAQLRHLPFEFKRLEGLQNRRDNLYD